MEELQKCSSFFALFCALNIWIVWGGIAIFPVIRNFDGHC